MSCSRDLRFIVTNMSLPSRSVVRFYNKRGTAEQWIKEGKQATHWTRLSCHRFRANEVRLQLSVLAYNLDNLWRRLGLPQRIKSWSLTSLQHRLMKTGGRLVKPARYYWLLLAEGHLSRKLFGDMLRRICGATCARRVTSTARTQPAYAGCRGSARERMLLKGPLRFAGTAHDRPAFEGRSGSERSTEPGSSAKTVASQPVVGYRIRARTAQKEILASWSAQAGIASESSPSSKPAPNCALNSAGVR